MVRHLLRQNAAQVQRVIFCAVKTAYEDGPKPLEFCTLRYCFVTSGGRGPHNETVGLIKPFIYAGLRGYESV